MSKRRKDLEFYADEEGNTPLPDRDMYEAPKGKRPRSRDRKKSAKKGFYDD